MRPGNETPQMLEMLKKAGMKEEDLSLMPQAPSKSRGSEKKANDSNMGSDANSDLVERDVAADRSVSGKNPATQAQEVEADDSKPRRPRKKSVSFAEGTKPESSSGSRSPKRPIKPSVPARQDSEQLPAGVSKLAQESFPPNVRAIELDDEERPIGVNAPTNPLDESPEDGALRREMKQYSFNEVGAIVAQLDAEEGSSSDVYSEDDETDDDEDDYGIAHGTHMDDEYREKMLELEKKLGVSMIQNIGPQSTEPTDAPKEEAADDRLTTNHSTSGGTPKGVRFAQELDVAPSTKAHDVATSRVAESREVPISAFKDTIVERKPTSHTDYTPPQPQEKVSKFKASRQNTQSTSRALQGLLSDIKERPPRPTSAVLREPDGLDSVTLDREVRNEYHRKRTELIDRQDGFSGPASNEQDDVLDEDDVPRDASGNRISRFKAARMDPSRAW